VRRRQIVLVALAVFAYAGAASASLSCMYVYMGDSVSCIDYIGGSYCEVVPRYEYKCMGSLDVGGGIPTDPYIPGGGVPTYVDPAYLYIEYIDDTNPESIQAVVNADQRLDNFALYMNGDPYGTGWGTGRVAVGSLPASAFNGGNANISVQGCGLQADICAAASATTHVQDDQKVETSPIIVAWPEPGAIFSLGNYDRSHAVRFKRRVYSTWSSPGNTQFTFVKSSTGLSYTWLGGQSVLRNEDLTWKVTPGSFWSNVCSMTSDSDGGDYIDKPYTTTDSLSCDLAGVVGAAGLFNSSITWIYRQQVEGLNHGAVVSGTELEVSIP